jgi:twitching motility protein PilT
LEADKMADIVENMARGKYQNGMQTFDQAIMALLAKKLITEDEAIRNSTSPNDFKLKISLGQR